MKFLTIIIVAIVGSLLSLYMCKRTNIVNNLKSRLNLKSSFIKRFKRINFISFMASIIIINAIDKSDSVGRNIVGGTLLLILVIIIGVGSEIMDSIQEENNKVEKEKVKKEYKINFCYYCGTEVKEEASKCPSCGQDLEL